VLPKSFIYALKDVLDCHVDCGPTGHCPLVEERIVACAVAPDKSIPANQFLALMKQLSGWASTQDLIAQSLVEGVKTFKTDGDHKPWTAEQLAAADKHLTAAMRCGYLLCRYTGQRGSDVVKLGPTLVDDGGFNVVQQKTKREVWCPILRELAAEMKSWPRQPDPYLRQESGKPYTRKLYWEQFDRAREGIPELANVTLHGLRCTAVIPTVTARAAPMARLSVQRQVLEVGAECVSSARSICAGGGQQWPSLPR